MNKSFCILLGPLKLEVKTILNELLALCLEVLCRYYKRPFYEYFNLSLDVIFRASASLFKV